MEKIINSFLGLAFLFGITLTACNIDKGEIGSPCNNGGDCRSGSCKNDSCAPPEFCAQNGQKDGNETDVDCGGIFCTKCGGGKACLHGSDCASDVCLNNRCTDMGDGGVSGKTEDGGTVKNDVDSSTVPSTDLGGNQNDMTTTPAPDLIVSNDLTPPCGNTLCGNACVDIKSDAKNCGACGAICVGGQFCSNGTCSCFMGETSCFGKCINTTSDASNCGACGKLCQPGEVCSAGACTVQCGKPSKLCSGQCVDVVNDPRHCGGCNVGCSTKNMDTVTCQGFCNGACKMNFADCNGDKQTDGCESNLVNDPNHCGDCATACPARANSLASCSNSFCTITCNAGFGNCNFFAGDGCESNFSSDPNNCGACFNACAQGEQCIAGKCVVQCAMGKTACGNICSDTTSDVSNCGACNIACTQGQNCTASKCVQMMGGGQNGQACAVDGDCATGLCIQSKCQRAILATVNVKAPDFVKACPNGKIEAALFDQGGNLVLTDPKANGVLRVSVEGWRIGGVVEVTVTCDGVPFYLPRVSETAAALGFTALQLDKKEYVNSAMLRPDPNDQTCRNKGNNDPACSWKIGLQL